MIKTCVPYKINNRKVDVVFDIKNLSCIGKINFMKQFFKDLKVVELASVLAGPNVGMFFAELGAEVIKVENSLTNGDVTRQWKMKTESIEKNYSAYYCNTNWGKMSVFLNLRNSEDKRKVDDLLKEADVVIANFKTGAAQKLGVDYDSVKAINSKIIYGEISGFSSESKRVAFDVVMQAESGFMFMNGNSDGPPVKMPVALIDLMAAHQLKEGILLALINRMKTGLGTKVSVSLFDAAVASLANQATNWLMADHIPQRMGSLHPNIAPYGEQFISRDKKHFVLAIGNNKQFEKLCEFLKLEKSSVDERFSKNTARVENRLVLAKLLQDKISQIDMENLSDNFTKLMVPFGEIRNMPSLFELPQAQNLILEEKMEDGEISKRVKTVVFKMEE